MEYIEEKICCLPCECGEVNVTQLKHQFSGRLVCMTRQTFTPQVIVLLFHKYPEKPVSLVTSLCIMIRIGNLDAWIQSRDKIESPTDPYHSSTHPSHAGPCLSPLQRWSVEDHKHKN